MSIEQTDSRGCALSDGTYIIADVIVCCIGFERNADSFGKLIGRTEVRHSNYLDKHLMYLADAEFDMIAYNSFFGSNTLEVAKFYTHVFIEGLRRPDLFGDALWGDQVPTSTAESRKWTHLVNAANNLILDHPELQDIAIKQVEMRIESVYLKMPPAAFEVVNLREWNELHTCLSGESVPSSPLTHPLTDVVASCASVEAVLGLHVARLQSRSAEELMRQVI